MKNKYKLKYVELLIRVLGMVKEILPSDGVVSTGAEDILSEEKKVEKRYCKGSLSLFLYFIKNHLHKPVSSHLLRFDSCWLSKLGT